MNQPIDHDFKRTAPRWLRHPAVLPILIGIVLLAFGLLRGEAYQVWLRAVQICLGCIGIG